jgi:hypothetical protein
LLSIIRLDKLREIHWEEYWAHNKEPFTANYEIHVLTPE